MEVLEFLEKNVKSDMLLPELVDVFEKMCSIPLEGKTQIVLETGVFDFTGEGKFDFALTRKYSEGAQQYLLQMEVVFPATEKNKHLNGEVNNTDVEGDFFRCVRSSRAYLFMKGIPPIDVKIFLDET